HAVTMLERVAVRWSEGELVAVLGFKLVSGVVLVRELGAGDGRWSEARVDVQTVEAAVHLLQVPGHGRRVRGVGEEFTLGDERVCALVKVSGAASGLRGLHPHDVASRRAPVSGS